ncbi:MAG: hypothetical protein FJ026_09850 [Chloroflexi bacterium]|nr:hypothetical protein [Chloroflexota bacterium]
MTSDTTEWLLRCEEPWTRYRTLTDLLGRPESTPEVRQAREAMLAHPRVQSLAKEAATWPGGPIRRHNDASHALYKLSTLADFGLQAGDAGLDATITAVLARQSIDGAFQSLVNIPQAFGGSGEDTWTWVLCDAPTLLYVLLAMGLGQDPRVQSAVHHLVGLVEENGWRCVAAPELDKFRGPGRRSDPCPIANVLILKALARAQGSFDPAVARRGVEMLLEHWEHRRERKPYLFGMGTDFCRLKYPFVWYDILHVADVLSQFPIVYGDRRFQEIVAAITAQADEAGQYTAGSMYRSWSGWSFADKKRPSPCLTFLVLRIQKRCGMC